jgi:arginine exporter protein ArgO
MIKDSLDKLFCGGRIPFEFRRPFFTRGVSRGTLRSTPDDQEVVAMSLLISGIVSVILGVIGFSLWWSDFVILLKGGVPIMLMLGGILAVYVGLDAMQDRMREERQKQEEKLDKTREEIEQVKAQAEQYREEIEKLKEQARKNTP